MSDSELGIKVDLSGQIALVTGASQGLGQACAQRLGEAGAHTICLARSEEKLKATVASIEAAGGTAEIRACDVGDRESVQSVFKYIAEKHEKLDIIVNNAGITRDTLLPRMTDEQWDDVIQTNLSSCFLCCREASKIES